MMLRIEISKLIHWRVSLWLKELWMYSCRRSKPPGFTSVPMVARNSTMMKQTRHFRPLPVYSTFLRAFIRCLPWFASIHCRCSVTPGRQLQCPAAGMSSGTLWCGPHHLGSSASNKLREKTCETPLRPPRNNHTRNSKALLQPSLGSW